MKITKRSIFAADEFDDFDMEEYEEDDAALNDQLDDIQDSVEDIQDSVDDIKEDDPAIDLDNNITNHLIAECENCKGIFISAMIASEQDVESINGVCPLCNKNTTQTLKWIIKDYPE